MPFTSENAKKSLVRNGTNKPMDAIKEKLESISLLVMMLTEGDDDSIDIIVSTIEEIEKLASDGHAELEEACRAVSNSRKESEWEPYVEQIKNLISTAQAYVEKSGQRYILGSCSILR